MLTKDSPAEQILLPLSFIFAQVNLKADGESRLKDCFSFLNLCHLVIFASLKPHCCGMAEWEEMACVRVCVCVCVCVYWTQQQRCRLVDRVAQ